MKTIKIISIIILAFFLTNCEDILEKNISNNTIQTIYPTAMKEVQGNVVNFQWNKVDGAKKYRLQIFSQDQSILLEKEVEESSFSYSFTLPGQYQWRVRAENNAYLSPYSLPITFSTVVSDVLTNQTLSLSTPINDNFTNNKVFTLTWIALTAATSYEVDVVNATTGATALPVTTVTTASAPLTTSNFPIDGKYQWKVKAMNSISNTSTTSAIFTFSIDTTVPNQPTNTLPAVNSSKTLNTTVDFAWTINPDSGIIKSPVNYSIEFSSDLNFTEITQTSDAITTSFSKTFTAVGIYYWRIKAKDSAGNISPASAPFKLTIT